MPIPHARRMNRIALALLIIALIAFIAFHFLPWQSQAGWKIWGSILGDLTRFRRIDGEGAIAMASLFATSVMLVAGPFLISVFQRSRLIWWLVTIVAGSALVGLSGVIAHAFFTGMDFRFGSGMGCLVAAQTLNFLGLFFIRRDQAAELT